MTKINCYIILSNYFVYLINYLKKLILRVFRTALSLIKHNGGQVKGDMYIFLTNSLSMITNMLYG